MVLYASLVVSILPLFQPRKREESYRFWIRHIVLFHQKRHPREMGASEVQDFLTYLAGTRKASASTQFQALSGLVFLYDGVMEKPLDEISGLQRVQRRHRVPVVLPVAEVSRFLTRMSGTTRLMAGLLYGAGLRVTECVTLRVKDIDLAMGRVTVRDASRDVLF